MNKFNIYASVYNSFISFFGYGAKDNILMNQLDLKSSKLVLDVGGGTGNLAYKISKHVKKVIVLDSSEEMLKRVHDGDKVEKCFAFAQSIPFNDEKFDLVLCIDALHHIKEIDEAIKEISRVTKKKGRVVVCEFDIKGIVGWLFWLFEKVLDNSKFIKPKALIEKMEDNGFSGKIIKLTGLEYLYVGEKK